MGKGKLIVMEGLDGSGKATQTSLLCEYLESLGHKVRHIEFPDYQEPSSALVKMYLNKEFGPNPDDVNAYAASSFYAVDRYASFLRFWREDYLSGAVIVADRYTTSNAVYQMEKTPQEDWNKYLSWLQDYEYGKLRLPRPDLVLFLDMPTEISQKLLSARYAGDERKKDLHESNVEFLARCRQTALYAAEEMGWHTVPCSQGKDPRRIEAIQKDIREIVSRAL